MTFTRVDELPESVRGQGGFGSSGYGDRSGTVSSAAENVQEGTRA